MPSKKFNKTVSIIALILILAMVLGTIASSLFDGLSVSAAGYLIP